MFALFQVIALICGFFRLGIVPIKTNPNALANIEQDGALVPNGAIVAALSSVVNNGAVSFGNWGFTRIPATLAARTYNGNEMVQGIVLRGQTGAYTDSTDTATNIVNAIPGAQVNQTFPFILANLGAGTATLAAGTGVTITGSAIVSGLSARLFIGTVTGSNAVTLANMFSFNAGGGTQFL